MVFQFFPRSRKMLFWHTQKYGNEVASLSFYGLLSFNDLFQRNLLNIYLVFICNKRGMEIIEVGLIGAIGEIFLLQLLPDMFDLIRYLLRSNLFAKFRQCWEI